MKLSRLVSAFALVAAVSLAVPAVAQAGPHEFGAGVTLELPRAALPTVTVALSAPLAQVDAPSVETDLAPVADALSHAFAQDGRVNWIVAAPLLVWLLVYALRKWVAGLVPGKFGDWLRSRMGGLVLGALAALALAFIDFALGGGALTVSAVLGLLIKWAFAWGGSIAGHETVKNLVQHAGGNPAGETAMVTLSRAARGPNP